jgi:hypothetical protein
VFGTTPLKVMSGAAAAVCLGWAGYALTAWSRYGRVGHLSKFESPLDRFMPRHEVRELHETKVAATADSTYEAALALDLKRSPLVRAIFRGREFLMGASSAQRHEQGFLSEILALGWGVLAETERGMTFGAVTQPWHADVRFRAIPPEEFATFSEPGYAKIAWGFWVDDLGSETSMFRTETRVATTDPASRERFRIYWSFFSPGIRLIRHETLRLVRAEAERRARVAIRAEDGVRATAAV